MTHFGQLWSTRDTLGQNPSQNPLEPLVHPCRPRTFAVFSKFHLNTSNSFNIKVAQFVEGHNLHVEWNLRFEVQICDKAWSTLTGTIH
jgi:anthranilate phosphoribosyltransferase